MWRSFTSLMSFLKSGSSASDSFTVLFLSILLYMSLISVHGLFFSLAAATLASCKVIPRDGSRKCPSSYSRHFLISPNQRFACSLATFIFALSLSSRSSFSLCWRCSRTLPALFDPPRPAPPKPLPWGLNCADFVLFLLNSIGGLVRLSGISGLVFTFTCWRAASATSSKSTGAHLWITFFFFGDGCITAMGTWLNLGRRLYS